MRKVVWGTVSRPEPTLGLAAGITGRLVYVVGDRDHVITAEQRDQIAAGLAAAGVDHDFVVVPGAAHAFLSEDTDTFHPAAAAETWALLARELAALRP